MAQEVARDTRTLAQIQIDGILANRTTDEILREIFALHPENSRKDRPTSKQCVAWYRSHLRRTARGARTPRLFREAVRGHTYDGATDTWRRAEPPAPVEAIPDMGF